MNRFQQLSSIVFLLLAFIYPPRLAEAKEITQNHVLNEESSAVETNLVGDKTRELLLARCTRRNYYGRRRNRRHYRYGSYYGQNYRYGRWYRVRDRHGRLVYEWRRYY